MSYHVNEVQRPMRAAFAEERAEGRCSMAKIQLNMRATVTICMRSNQSCMHAIKISLSTCSWPKHHKCDLRLSCGG